VIAKKLPGQLPTDCGPLPRLLYSVDEVAAMFGKAPDTIREAVLGPQAAPTASSRPGVPAAGASGGWSSACGRSRRCSTTTRRP
jgi:hypothetical protein